MMKKNPVVQKRIFKLFYLEKVLVKIRELTKD